MKNLGLTFVALALAGCQGALVTTGLPVANADAVLAARVAREILIKTRPGRAAPAYARLGVAPRRAIAGIGWQVVEASGDPAAAIAALRADPAVAAVEPQRMMRLFKPPTGAPPLLPRNLLGVPAFNDPDFANRKATHACIRLHQAWELTLGAPEVIVAILDTGVDPKHPDLMNQLVPGRDTINDDDIPEDDHSHGTACAGVVAAEANNAIGILGMAPRCKVMPIKVLNKRGVGPLEWAAKGIVWAADHGASVTSNSYGEDVVSQVLQDAVDYARAKGTMTVASMGNDGEEATHWPAACTNVLAVGATYDDDRPALFTAEGKHVGIAAPGTRVYTTSPTYEIVDPMFGKRDLNYTWFSGTSASGPIVAAVAALVRSTHPGMPEDQLRALLRRTSDDVGTPGWDKQTGDGRVNAFRALTEAR